MIINKKYVQRAFLVTTIIVVFNPWVVGQSNQLRKSYKKLSRPEKWWVVSHPFIAKKAFLITEYSLTVTDSLKKSGKFDDDISGGQIDAFKHMSWMAFLTQKIKWKKCRRLGIAHEKGNYISFKKNFKKGKKTNHDKVSSEMDLWNNDVGIRIGLENKETPKKELQKIIILAILSGEGKIIKKNSNSDFLDCEDQIIFPDSIVGRWENEKCLVSSDYTRRKIEGKR